MTKGQAVITEKYGAHNCNVGEDGGFAPNISRQAFYWISTAFENSLLLNTTIKPFHFMGSITWNHCTTNFCTILHH